MHSLLPTKIFLIIVLLIFPVFNLHPQGKIFPPELIQAVQLAYSGNYKKAGTLAEIYIQNNPGDPNGYMVRGMVFDWERILSSKPGIPLKEKTAEYHKKANQIAFQIWHRNQDDVDALIDLGNSYIFLGRAYSDLGKGLKAVLTAKHGPKHLKKALGKNPNRTDALTALGFYNYIADSTPKHLAAFKSLLGIKGSRSEGFKQLQRAATVPHPFQYDALVALYYICDKFEEDYPQALNYIQKLKEIFPENPKWQFLVAEFLENQDTVKGIKGYADFIVWCKAGKERCSDKFYFLAYFRSGRIAKQLGQSEGAKDLLNKALTFAPESHIKSRAEALILLAELEAESGNLALALKNYRRADELNEISKSQKTQIRHSIEKICQEDPPPPDC